MRSEHRKFRPLLSTLTRVFAVWAALLWVTGGGTIVVGGLRLSSRGALRPALAGLACAGVWAALSTADERRRATQALRGRADRLAAPLAVLVALSIAGVSIVYGTHVAGGSDSSGYVSQSRLWAAGRDTIDVPRLDDGPWPERGWIVAPLGYVPSQMPDRLGPTYAPGLPWLMALGGAVAGEPGRYVWTPIAVALLTWGAFVWTRREAPPSVGLAAAVLVASTPGVVFAATQAMSDLPGAALWMLVVLALTGGGAWSLAGAAAAAALALAVRPNLVPLAALVWLTTAVDLRTRTLGSLRRPLVLGIALAVPALTIAWINQHLWGSAFMSGYGAPRDLFLVEQVWPNLVTIWRWLGETRAYWLAAGVPALLWCLRGPTGARWWPALGVVAGVLLCYLSYGLFVEWWYLRFYLPAVPLLATAICIVVWRILARWIPDLAGLVVVALAVTIGTTGIDVVRDAGVFALWRTEWRYWAIADWTRRHAPPDAVFLSVQHSGSLAADSGHWIARWDLLPAEGLDAFVERMQREGRVCWLVGDEWEEAQYRARFATISARGRLEWAPLAVGRVDGYRVRIFDLTTPTRTSAPVVIPVISGGPWPWRRGPVQTSQ